MTCRPSSHTVSSDISGARVINVIFVCQIYELYMRMSDVV